MKVCCISDLHGELPELPASDLTIIAGDLVPATWKYANSLDQSKWINKQFKDWINNLPCKEIVYIAGNHDKVFEDHVEWLNLNQIKGHYLFNEDITLLGYKIWGSPYSQFFNDWHFNFSKDVSQSYQEQESLWGQIPEDVEILVTHEIPFGYGDKVNNFRRVGSKNLLSRIRSLPRLKLHVCGHIHEDQGVRQIGQVTTVNATHLNGYYHPYDNGFIIIDLPDKS